MLKMERHIDIDRFDYDLPDERIAKYPLEERSASKLLVYERGEISERRFRDIGDILPEGTLLVFNNTKVIRARIIMHKPSGARIEVFCLEPHDPADYERAFAVKGSCRWSCIVGNLKKWKEGPLVIDFEYEGRAERMLAWREGEGGREQIVRFEWTADLTFGQLLEHLGRIPIPPYLNRESQEIDNTRYQTVYSKFEGSVGRSDGRPALHTGVDRADADAGVFVRRGDPARGGRNISARERPRCGGASDAYGTFRDSPQQRGAAAGEVG